MARFGARFQRDFTFRNLKVVSEEVYGFLVGFAFFRPGMNIQVYDPLPDECFFL